MVTIRNALPPETTRDLRKGRTLPEVAAAAGLDPDGLADTLRGATCPRLDTALRIADALGVTLDRFARAWLETRRRRVEREYARAAALAAREKFISRPS